LQNEGVVTDGGCATPDRPPAREQLAGLAGGTSAPVEASRETTVPTIERPAGGTRPCSVLVDVGQVTQDGERVLLRVLSVVRLVALDHLVSLSCDAEKPRWLLPFIGDDDLFDELFR